MKKVALLFGYCYSANPAQDLLESSYFDLFIAYEYLSQRGFQCLVFDDFASQRTVESLYHKKGLNVHFLSFHSHSTGRNYRKLGTINPFHDLSVQETLADCTCLFLYYTGHMTKKGEFCFPYATVSMASFFHQIGLHTPAHCQIFCINDSCYSGKPLFPYTFQKEKVQLRTDLEETFFALTQKCIYISSAAAHEEAITSQHRSHFTKYIFQQLNQGIVQFQLLLNEIQKRLYHRRSRLRGEVKIQTAGIACSHRMPPRLWTWIFGYSFVDCGKFLVVLESDRFPLLETIINA